MTRDATGSNLRSEGTGASADLAVEREVEDGKVEGEQEVEVEEQDGDEKEKEEKAGWWGDGFGSDSQLTNQRPCWQLLVAPELHPQESTAKHEPAVK